jgi:hypothetical protein
MAGVISITIKMRVKMGIRMGNVCPPLEEVAP